MSDCNGKCTYCGKTDFPNLSDGKEVNIGYSYAYKVDCCGDRYISAEEVKYLLNKARADAIGEYATILMSVFSHSCDFYRTVDGINIEAIEKQNIDDVILKCLEKVKGQNNE